MIRQAQTPIHRTARRRAALSTLAAVLVAAAVPIHHASAQDGRPTRGSSKAKPAAAKAASQAKPAASARPTLIATIGDWGVYATAPGRDRTCYALAQPKERAPASLKRDPAYLFVSTRPAENVRHEVSIIMGFDVKGDKTPPESSIGSDTFALAAQGSHLWVRDAADGTPMVEAMRKGSTMTVKATSARGNLTTDTYSLSGVTAALSRVDKECP